MTFKVTDKRHTPPVPPFTITDFIEARRVELLAECGHVYEYLDARGEPCPLPDCDQPIDGVTRDHVGHYFVLHSERHQDDIEHEITGEQFERIALGELTADATFARRLAEAIPVVLDAVLAYEMTLDSGQGRAVAETVEAVQALAAIWRDHPDYDPAWRPR